MQARTWLGSLYSNIGWAFHNQGKYEQALDAFHKSYDALERQRHGKGCQDCALVYRQDAPFARQVGLKRSRPS